MLSPPQGKINLDLRTLQGLSRPRQSSETGSRTGASGASGGSTGTVPCWGFATFDGHAGPACAHFLKENFMVGSCVQLSC